jgi:flagellar protein FliS
VIGERDMDRSVVLSYRTTRLANLDTRRQVLALYERSIQLSKQAVSQFNAQDVDGALERLEQCVRCVSELQAALNFFDGEEIAVNLWRLYQFAREGLERAGLERDEKPLEDVLFILETLRDGWMQIVGLTASRRAVIVRTYREPTQASVCC